MQIQVISGNHFVYVCLILACDSCFLKKVSNIFLKITTVNFRSVKKKSLKKMQSSKKFVCVSSFVTLLIFQTYRVCFEAFSLKEELVNDSQTNDFIVLLLNCLKLEYNGHYLNNTLKYSILNISLDQFAHRTMFDNIFIDQIRSNFKSQTLFA